MSMILLRDQLQALYNNKILGVLTLGFISKNIVFSCLMTITDSIFFSLPTM